MTAPNDPATADQQADEPDVYRMAALASTAHHVRAGRITADEAETSARASARHAPFRAAVDAAVAHTEQRVRAEMVGGFLAGHTRGLDEQTRRIIRERDEAKAEVAQWKATYGETALRDATAVIRERDEARAQLAQAGAVEEGKTDAS